MLAEEVPQQAKKPQQ